MFRDRSDAGRRLAACFDRHALVEPVVLGIPRGGVAVAAALARELDAELDVVLARKLRAPGQPELAMGAVTEEGEVLIDEEIVGLIGASPEAIEAERRHQLEEIERRKSLIRAVRPAAGLEGRSVIVTDDGVATGSTMLAALRALRARRPREIIVAVPVGAPDRIEALRAHCDSLIVLAMPAHFIAIGRFYDRFDQLTDAEMLALLRAAAPKKS